MLDDLRVSGKKAKQTTFGSKKDIGTLNLASPKDKKDKLGSQSPKSNTMNKWNKAENSAIPSLEQVNAGQANYGNAATLKEQEEEILTADNPASENRRLREEMERDSARNASESTTNYAKILKMGEISTTKKDKKDKVKKTRNIISMKQSSSDI